ncbi:hypothetical protein AGMMS49938_11270 [Fibrobacterales bacterium]|nr:hypothetical protein AGMMS49938_11270 [Fibrobacterales bacterium]
MYATYHLQTDELSSRVIDSIKDVFKNQRLVILTEAAYSEMEKSKRNLEYLARIDKAEKDIDSGKGIVKTIAELEKLADE